MRAGRSGEGRAALVLPTALAAVLVLWHLGRAPLWRDEIASVTIADRGLGSMARVVGRHEANMALYDAMLHPWSRLGDQEWLLRLPSALFAIAAVPLVVCATRRCAGPTGGWVAGVVVALNAFLVLTGQQARGYALLMALAALSALLLLRAVQDRRRSDWVAWALTLAALPWAHVLGGLMVVAELASLLTLPPARRPLRTLAACVGGAAVAWLPLAFLLHRGDHNRTTWVPAFGIDRVRQTAEALAGDRVVLAALVLATLVVVWQLAAAARDHGRSVATWSAALPLCWVIVPPVVLGVVSEAQSTWVDRYLVELVPGFGVLAGVAVAGLRADGRRLAAAGVAALLLAASVRSAALTPHPSPAVEDLRAAAQVVAGKVRPGDQMVFAPAFARPGFGYYLARTGKPVPRDLALARSAIARGDLFAEELPARVVAARMSGAGRLWVLGYVSSDWHPTPEPVLRVAPAVLRHGFRTGGAWRVGQLSVQLYEPAPSGG